MGSKVERGAAKDILLHMCLLHLFCRGGLKCGKRGINTARCFGLEELLSFIIILIVGMVSGSHLCFPRLPSLSGSAPWPSFSVVVRGRKNTLRVRKTARHACGVQGGTYLRWSAHMWMSCETKRGLTAQPSLLFWRVCSPFFRCPFVSGARRDWTAPSHERYCAHTHFGAAVAPEFGSKLKFQLSALAQLFVYQLTPFFPACQFDWIVWDCSPTSSNKTGRRFHVFKCPLARTYFFHVFCWALKQRGVRNYACVEFFLPCELRATPRGCHFYSAELLYLFTGLAGKFHAASYCWCVPKCCLSMRIMCFIE
ncbi:hypothetical protein TcG_13418 [Trypanosoma cruzi]|nr:hypothetical protein TcG_13418 [Trypanosoma cruzi]